MWPVEEIFTYPKIMKILSFFFRFYLFILREGMGEREGNINVWLPLMHPLLGTWPTTQACALAGNWTADPSIHRPSLNHWATPAREDPLLFSSRSVAAYLSACICLEWTWVWCEAGETVHTHFIAQKPLLQLHRWKMPPSPVLSVSLVANTPSVCRAVSGLSVLCHCLLVWPRLTPHFLNYCWL